MFKVGDLVKVHPKHGPRFDGLRVRLTRDRGGVWECAVVTPNHSYSRSYSDFRLCPSDMLKVPEDPLHIEIDAYLTRELRR